MRPLTLIALLVLLICPLCIAIQAGAAPPPATAPARVGRLPHLEVDVDARQVRVACQALRVEAPLEFFCCVTGTSEHEAVLRSPVKPSDLHTALLMIGLEPGEPVRYSEAAKKWLPPHGPPLRITVEFDKDGKRVALPAYKLMRAIRTKQPMPALTWIFAGSRVMEDGNYAADVTGYLVSIVNFELTVIDVPALASNANETLQWETNLDLMPEAGTPVTMIIEPAGTELEPDGLGARAPIDLPIVKVGRGDITLDDRPMSIAELDAALAELRRERPPHIRLAAAENAPPLLVETVRRVARKNDVEVDEVPALPVVDADARAEGIQVDERRLQQLRQRWDASVRPHREALREAAQTQYEVIAQLRREQQRLIDEADRIQRLIDQLEREYQEMTAPRPPPAGGPQPPPDAPAAVESPQP